MISAITAALSALWTGAKALAANEAVKTAVATVGANVAGEAVKDKLGLNKAQIGTGTQAGTQAGAEMEYVPVGNSTEDLGITEFEYQNPADQTPDMNEEELMALLNQAGVNQQGVMSAAIGGYLKRDNGGSIKIPNVAITPEINYEFDTASMQPEVPREMGMFKNWWHELDDDTKKRMTSILTNIGTSLALKEMGLGHAARTIAPKVLGAAKRKINIKPIGGSFANGGVLNRPMFMPHGGAMRGPGGPKDDLIPVMASNGEFMLSKAAVDQAGSGNHNKGIARLTAFNNMGNRRYGN